MRRFTPLVLMMIVLLSGCHPLYGFIESEFTLAPESRLPRWFTIPPGYMRKDLTMTITVYTHPLFSKVKIIIRGPAPEYKVLAKEIGTDRWHPLTEQQGYNTYPNYSIISVDEVEEVYEQRRPEPFLHITDDPKLTDVLKQSKTSY